MSAGVAVLVAVAVLALAGPGRGRRWAAVRAGGADGRRADRGAGAATRPRTWRGRRGATGIAGDGTADLAGLLHAVAAQVRAGVAPGAAWSVVLGRPTAGVPDVDDLVAAGGRAVSRTRVRAVVAGAHVAAETGAPLADVLEQLADAVAADAEQAGELDAALAGPRATARVLTALPLLGLLVGAAMGARPWEVLTDGGLGSALAVLGVGLVVAGRLWVGALLRRAGAS